jgi:hypothetical protein
MIAFFFGMFKWLASQWWLWLAALLVWAIFHIV